MLILAFFVPLKKKGDLPPEVNEKAADLYAMLKDLMRDNCYSDGLDVLCSPLSATITATGHQYNDWGDSMDLILKIIPAGQSEPSIYNLKLSCEVLCLGDYLSLNLTEADLSDLAKVSNKTKRMKAIGDSNFIRYDLHPKDYSNTTCMYSFKLGESNSESICGFLGNIGTNDDLSHKSVMISYYDEGARMLARALAILIYCAEQR